MAGSRHPEALARCAGGAGLGCGVQPGDRCARSGVSAFGVVGRGSKGNGGVSGSGSQASGGSHAPGYSTRNITSHTGALTRPNLSVVRRDVLPSKAATPSWLHRGERGRVNAPVQKPTRKKTRRVDTPRLPDGLYPGIGELLDEAFEQMKLALFPIAGEKGERNVGGLRRIRRPQQDLRFEKRLAFAQECLASRPPALRSRSSAKSFTEVRAGPARRELHCQENP